MKNTYTILVLSFAFNSFSVNAQDTQKWYADDIYYNSNEKEINYLEIFYEDQEYDQDSYDAEDSYEDEMSYSMRIN